MNLLDARANHKSLWKLVAAGAICLMVLLHVALSQQMLRTLKSLHDHSAILKQAVLRIAVCQQGLYSSSYGPHGVEVLHITYGVMDPPLSQLLPHSKCFAGLKVQRFFLPPEPNKGSCESWLWVQCTQAPINSCTLCTQLPAVFRF